jgi:hypothetical protein
VRELWTLTNKAWFAIVMLWQIVNGYLAVVRAYGLPRCLTVIKLKRRSTKSQQSPFPFSFYHLQASEVITQPVSFFSLPFSRHCHWNFPQVMYVNSMTVEALALILDFSKLDMAFSFFVLCLRTHGYFRNSAIHLNSFSVYLNVRIADCCSLSWR